MKLLRAYREPLIWTLALVLLFLFGGNAGFTLCPLKLLGFAHCPGCGLGRSVHAALHGRLAESWQLHWLGMPAALVLICHIFKTLTAVNCYQYEPTTVFDAAQRAAP